MIGHNETVVGYIPGPGDKKCTRCKRWVKRDRQMSHVLMHHRINLVHAMRMDSNRRGIDFQPGLIAVAPQNGVRRPRRSRSKTQPS